MFRVRLPSIFITCHKMPRLPRNLHLLTTSRSPDNAIRKTRDVTRLKCCACQEKWRWSSPKCCACHEKCNSSSENDAKALRLPRKTIFDALWNMFWNVTKCHACHTTFETSKSDRFCRTRHRHGHFTLTTVARGRLQTVADGCEHQSSVERTRLTQTPKVKREPFATHSGKSVLSSAAGLPFFIQDSQLQKPRINHTLYSFSNSHWSSEHELGNGGVWQIIVFKISLPKKPMPCLQAKSLRICPWQNFSVWRTSNASGATGWFAMSQRVSIVAKSCLVLNSKRCSTCTN